MNPVTALIIANLIWGAASPIFKLSLQNIPPFTLAFIRFFFAGLLFLYPALECWEKISLSQFGRICLGAFFGISINIGFYFLALPKTASINAPIIASSVPIFMFFFSVFFLRERPIRRVFIGILTAFVGVLVIILSPFFLDGGITDAAKESALEGNLFLVVATIGSVMHSIINKPILREINYMQVSFIGFLVGSLTFIPFMHAELQNWSSALLDYRGWLGILFGVLLSSGAAYVCFNYGISKIKMQEIGIFGYIDPVVAVILAVPLVHEYPTIPFYIGTVFVFAGVYIAERRIHWHPLFRVKKILFENGIPI